MSNTTRSFRGATGLREEDSRTKKQKHIKKHFGHTSGTHSMFEECKRLAVDELRNETNPLWLPTRQRAVDRNAGKTYPVKGVDFVKYGWGRKTGMSATDKRYNRTHNNVRKHKGPWESDL